MAIVSRSHEPPGTLAGGRTGRPNARPLKKSLPLPGGSRPEAGDQELDIAHMPRQPSVRPRCPRDGQESPPRTPTRKTTQMKLKNTNNEKPKRPPTKTKDHTCRAPFAVRALWAPAAAATTDCGAVVADIHLQRRRRPPRTAPPPTAAAPHQSQLLLDVVIRKGCDHPPTASQRI